MNNAEQWISLKDQQPGDDQFPVWYANQPYGTVWHSENVNGFHATHWKQAERRPAPPPRAKTLAEMDADLVGAFEEEVICGPLSEAQKMLVKLAVNHALAHERAEVAKILAIIDEPALQSFEVAGRLTSFIEKLRVRVKGGAS